MSQYLLQELPVFFSAAVRNIRPETPYSLHTWPYIRDMNCINGCVV